MSEGEPTSASPRAGKRLAWGRLMVAVGVVAMLVVGGIFVARSTSQTSLPFTDSEADAWFSGYLDVTLADDYALPTTDAEATSEAYSTTVLAFVVADPDDACTPSWGGYYDLDAASESLDLDRQIARYREAGGDVVVSFGGLVNDEIAAVCDNVDDASAAYLQVVERYELDTIDLDIEGVALQDTAGGQRRAAAIADVQSTRAQEGSDLAVWLTLPVAPTGLTEVGVQAVRQMIDAGVDLAGVNVMTMDYGVDLEGASMADAAQAALTATQAQLLDVYADAGMGISESAAWALLGATPMIGQNDIAGEIFTMEDAVQLNEFAHDQGLSRVSMWSLNRDRTCGENYPDTAVVSNECSGIDQEGQSFAAVLGAGMAGIAGATPTATPTALPSPAATAIVDDPETSPFPVWSEDLSYSAGVKVVRHGYVYAAKWWTDGSADPADPTVAATDSPWLYVGPVLATDEPFALPTVPEGTYPQWSASTDYPAGTYVVVDNVAYVSKWWTTGEDPRLSITDSTQGSWQLAETPSESASAAETP